MELHLKHFVETRIAAQITNYERDIALLQAFENRDVDYMGKYLETFMSKHFTPASAQAAVDRVPLPDDGFRNISSADYDQIAVDINLVKAYNRQLVIRYKAILSDAASFIQFIDKTYQ